MSSEFFEEQATSSRSDYLAEYAASAETVHGDVAALLEQYPPDATDRFICYEMSGDNQFARIGRYVERVRFNEFFANDAEEMAREYGPYEAASRFFVTVDQQQRQPTGVLRVIHDSPAGLKTLNDMSDQGIGVDEVRRAHGFDAAEQCWDIATVAALPEYSAGAASIQLYRGLYTAAVREGADHLVSIIDSHVLRQLKNYLGIPFVPLAGTKPFNYLGSPESQAVYGHVPEFYPKMDRRRRRSIRGFMARKVLDQLVYGSQDHTYEKIS